MPSMLSDAVSGLLHATYLQDVTSFPFSTASPPVAVTLALSATMTGLLVLDSSLAMMNCASPAEAGAPGVTVRVDCSADAHSCEVTKVMFLNP